MTEISFTQLQKLYNTTDQALVEVTDPSEARHMLMSPCSDCWSAGEKLGETGWIRLAAPSRRSYEKVRTIFVCRASLPKIKPLRCPRCGVRRLEEIAGHALRCLNCHVEWNKPLIDHITPR